MSNRMPPRRRRPFLPGLSCEEVICHQRKLSQWWHHAKSGEVWLGWIFQSQRVINWAINCLDNKWVLNKQKRQGSHDLKTRIIFECKARHFTNIHHQIAEPTLLSRTESSKHNVYMLECPLFYRSNPKYLYLNSKPRSRPTVIQKM